MDRFPREEVDQLLKQIPKKYHKAIKEISILYSQYRVSIYAKLVKDLSEIPIDKVDSYCVVHENELDGG